MTFLLAVAVCCVLLLVGCGPERSGAGSEQLEAEAERIATEYVNDGDIGRAVAQLDALEGVANPRQWVLLLTERYIAEGYDAERIASLVKLTDALGLDSSAVSTYAATNGLLDEPESVADSIVVVVETTPIAVQKATGSNAEMLSDGSSDSETDDTLSQENAQADGDAGEATADSAADASEETATTILLPTPTAVLMPTDTPESPKVRAESALNVRRGPGVLYAIVGGLQPGDQLDILAKNDSADWWQVTLPGDLVGWVYDPLVQIIGDVNGIAVAANIPPPPTPAPEVAEPVAAAPVAAEPEAETPTEEEASPPSDQPHFTLVSRRLWSKSENGGCSGQHLLRIHVLDANGNRLNGVALNNYYPPYETIVTGSQGKGDGIIEYDITDDGPGFSVIRDADGREATSDRAEGFTARSRNISEDLLAQAGYCNGPGLSSCAIFYDSFGCNGHHSWEAEFRRNY